MEIRSRCELRIHFLSRQSIKTHQILTLGANTLQDLQLSQQTSSSGLRPEHGDELWAGSWFMSRSQRCSPSRLKLQTLMEIHQYQTHVFMASAAPWHLPLVQFKSCSSSLSSATSPPPASNTQITAGIPVRRCPPGFHLRAVTAPANPQTDASGTQNEQKQRGVEKRGALRAC